MKVDKTIIITIFLLGLLMIGAVNAASDNNDTAVSSDQSDNSIKHSDDKTNNKNKISTTNDNNLEDKDNSEDSNKITDKEINKLKTSENDKLRSTEGSFTNLAEDINTATNELNLTRNYIYDDSDSSYKNGIDISKPITINGNGFTINGDGKSRVFNINENNVTLKNIIFIKSNNIDDYNMGMIWRGNNGKLINCSFINCSNFDGNHNSGAILWMGQNGSVINSQFVNCYAYDCGAIGWIGDNGSVINSQFVNCSARTAGAIGWIGDNGSVINSQFVNCSGILGGTVVWDGKRGNVNNCSFIKCSAVVGSAIGWFGEDGIISNSRFYNNIYNNIYNEYENEYTVGTIYWSSKNGTIFNCSFMNCSADYGSAIYEINDVGNQNINCNIIKCSFIDCSSIKGGAIYRNNQYGITNCQITSSNFINCKDILGNALYDTDYNEFNLNNCKFIDCGISNNGESIRFDIFKELNDKLAYKYDNIYNLNTNYIFYSKIDSKYVSGINITESITIEGNGFTIDGKNQARVFNIKSNNVILKNIIFVNCSASYGSAIYWEGNNGKLINCSFINCSADYHSTIYWANNKGSLINCSFINSYPYEKSRINLSYDNLFVGEVAKINYTLTKNAIGTLTIYLNNKFLKNIQVGEDINIGNLNEGNYVLKVVYNGDGYFEGCENIAKFEVVKQNTDCFDEILPAKYDLRDYGYVTSVKNQGYRGTCWAFTALSVLESCILKANGPNYDFSENNLINYIKYSDYGLNESYEGGNMFNALAYLLSWFGPVNDVDDPYNSNYKKYIQLNSQIHIQNVLFIDLDNNLDLKPIKEAIIKYGAVGISISWSTYYDYLNGSSYYNYYDTSTNHGITIVGWDDNYSRHNFYKMPKGDGAWIIKNSHGTDDGDNGYFYVSYYDTSISYIDKNIGAYTFILNDTTIYDKIYQYDYAGETSYSIIYDNQLWIKNVYNASRNEYLNAVSTYFLQELDYELEIYVNGEKQYTQSSKTKPGYYTIKLDQMIPLKTNDQFSVVYKLKTTDNNGIKIPTCDSYYLKKDYLKPNISFRSRNNINWKDTYVDDGFCNCIKAFTILNPINTEIKLDITNRAANTIDLIATVHDQYGLLVNSGNVTFNIGDSSQVINIKNGIAKLTNIIFNKGTINVEFKSIGYTTATISKLISNPLVDTKMNLIVTSEHNPSNIIAYITDLKNNPVKSGFVTFTTDNAIYTIDVIDGFANLTNIILNIGENHISAKYQELFYYKSSSNTTSINISLIKSKIELITNSEENLYEIIAKVSDLENNPINIGHITFNFPNNTTTLNVTNGIAKITYLFNKIGINNISVHYNNNLIYDSSNINKIIDVPKKEVKLNLNGNNPNPITDGNNGQNPETNNQGSAPSQGPTTNTPTNTQSNTDKPSFTQTKTVKSISKKAKQLTISTTLKLGTKKAKKGTKVTYKIGSKTFKVKTNNKGVSKLTIKKSKLQQILKKIKVGKKIKVQIKYGKTTVTKYIKVKK